eukprot:TRINITY_DN3277_c0_g2_i1.p2 TRINITY_DN3277_c0_g2~~TRINITY_DN3277_c0_g2_i1.p2  ORF type:complete len:144 (-),score=54.79 TRINITY_DN3277_c0_g2_i1:425-856(-)
MITTDTLHQAFVQRKPKKENNNEFGGVEPKIPPKNEEEDKRYFESTTRTTYGTGSNTTFSNIQKKWRKEGSIDMTSELVKDFKLDKTHHKKNLIKEQEQMNNSGTLFDLKPVEPAVNKNGSKGKLSLVTKTFNRDLCEDKFCE